MAANSSESTSGVLYVEEESSESDPYKYSNYKGLSSAFSAWKVYMSFFFFLVSSAIACST